MPEAETRGGKTVISELKQEEFFQPCEAPTLEWKHFDDAEVFECCVVLEQEESGYSAYAANLPGVASQGETLDEAIENIREAFQAALATYREEGMPIPWAHSVEAPKGSTIRRILVNA